MLFFYCSRHGSYPSAFSPSLINISARTNTRTYFQSNLYRAPSRCMATLIPHSSSPVNFNSSRYPFNHHRPHLLRKTSSISIGNEYCCMVNLAFERAQAIRRCFPTSLSKHPHHHPHPRSHHQRRRRSNCSPHAQGNRNVVNVVSRIQPTAPRRKRSFVTRLPGDGSLSSAPSGFISSPMVCCSPLAFSCTQSKMI